MNFYDMKSKIYCINCKYYGSSSSCWVKLYHPLFVGHSIDHRGERISTHKNEALYTKLFGTRSTGNSECLSNKDCKCPLYERRWWKFWIKPKKGPKHLLVELVK